MSGRRGEDARQRVEAEEFDPLKQARTLFLISRRRKKKKKKIYFGRHE
jgi:hypothetical protein